MLLHSASYTIFFFSLLFFSCTEEKIPTLTIIEGNTIQSISRKSYEVLYIEGNDTIHLQANIRSRGGFSIQYPKHSFSFESDKKYNFCELPQNDDWVLNASYIDKTFMRHKISYDLFREMNEANISPKCAYINIWLHNKPHGLYMLMEEVNASLVNLHKKDSMAMLFKEPPIFYDEIPKTVQDTNNLFQQKFPAKDRSNKMHYLRAFRNFLLFSNDALFSKEIKEWIDLDNIIDWHILLLFTNNSDGIMKNFYLYKKDAKTPLRVVPWDYDHSFGRDGDNELNMMKTELNCERSILFKRLMNAKELKYRKKLKETWFKYREMDIISINNMEKYISTNNRIIEKAVEENCKIWPYYAKAYHDDNNYKEELDILRKFVDLRINQLDTFFYYLQ